jgi:phage baseplate assembly protein gpV
VSFLPIDSTRRQALGASKIRGLRLAIVVDNKDGEGNPGYRVKLTFPWLDAQETSFWARIAVPMAGADRGTYVLPEIDDQVLVVFEHGDIDRPLVVGSLWSRKQEPVELNQSGKNNTKLIKSRCGHRIIFDDKAGAEKVTIVDRTRKNKIVLDSVNRIVKIESDGEIEVTAKASVIVHANALEVATEEGITGKARSLLVHGQKTFGLKATRGITIGGGSTTINVSNAAATSVSGAGAGELGGGGAETAREQVPAPQHSGGGGGTRVATGGAGSSTGADRDANREGGPDPDAGSTEDKKDWVKIELVDQDGKPAAMVRYQVTSADGREQTGLTDSDGKAYVEDITPGQCTITFPDLHETEWEAA